MNIVQIIPQLGTGGAERFVVDLCNQLCEQHEVMLVVLHSIDQYSFFAKEVSSKVKLISLNKKAGLDVRLFARLYRLVGEFSPDIIHTHLRGLFYSLPIIWRRQNKTKAVHTLHNDAFKEASSWIDRLYRKVLFYKKCVHPVVISETSQESFSHLYKMHSTLIYNGSIQPDALSKDTQNFIAQEYAMIKKNPEAKLIINVARVTKQKNHEVLAEAIVNLNKKGRAVELVVVGREYPELIANSLLLQSPLVHFLGEKKNPRDYIRMADAFCLSSIYEGMPISLIESLSVGAISICTPVGGMVDMIADGENGILTSGTTVEDIEQGIERFLTLSEDQKKLMKKNAEKSFIRYSMETCAQTYCNLFVELTDSKKSDKQQ